MLTALQQSSNTFLSPLNLVPNVRSTDEPSPALLQHCSTVQDFSAVPKHRINPFSPVHLHFSNNFATFFSDFSAISQTIATQIWMLMFLKPGADWSWNTVAMFRWRSKRYRSWGQKSLRLDINSQYNEVWYECCFILNAIPTLSCVRSKVKVKRPFKDVMWSRVP